MLMDMFYGATDGIIRHRQRFHFHEVSELLEVLLLIVSKELNSNSDIFFLCRLC